VKPAHLIASFFGHLVLLVLLGMASSLLKQTPPPPPDTIRISFGELPRAGGGKRREGRRAEITPAPPAAKEEAKPALPVAKPKEEPKAKEAAKPKETPKPAAAKPAEAVRPVTKTQAEKAPGAVVPAPAPGVPEATGTAAAGAKEAVPAPGGLAAGGPGAQPVGGGGSVQAWGDAGAGDSYLGLVQSKIGRRWQPSAASTQGRAMLEAIVSFRISASGEILEPEIFQASGLSVFDREALRAVIEANPLPAPPARFRAAGLSIQFSFTYRR
jgi:protein TonB